MKKRPAATTSATGTLFQVLVVGVLLFAVFWQISGSIKDDPVGPVADVSRVERTAKPFVTTDDVNLRRGPGLDHEVITVVPLHAEVLVTGASQNGFVPVTIDGTSAWVAESYVAPEGSVLGGTTGDMAVADIPQPTVAAPAPTVAAPEPTAVPTAAVEVFPEVVVEEPPVTFVQNAAAAEVAESEPVEEAASESVVASTFLEESEPATPKEPGERWIEVDRTTATVTLLEGDVVIDEFPALIGKDPSVDGFYSTATGTFYVHMKNRELTETPFAEGVYLTDFVGFDPERSNGFHSPTRDADGNVVQTGGTETLGCVRLGEDDARQLFDFASIGMRVEIHD